LREWRHSLLGASPETAHHLIATILVVVLIRALALRIIKERTEDRVRSITGARPRATSRSESRSRSAAA